MQIKMNDIKNVMLNKPMIEDISFLDMQAQCFDSTEDGEALEKMIAEGKAIVLPYEEQLYPYGEAMGDYLDDREILIPDGMKATAYLAQHGWLDDFYEFRAEGLEKRFVAWSEKQGVQIV